MKTLLKSILVSAALALLAIGPAQAAKEDAKTSTSSDRSSASAKADKSDKGAKSGAVMDINTASEKELATLPKIGDARAKAIVAGRPYRAKDELVEKKIISQDVYDTIKDRIIAKQGTSSTSAKSDAKKSDAKKSDAKSDTTSGAKSSAKSDSKKADENKPETKK